LESLGYREFMPQGWDTPIQLKEPTQPPLIVITTNEERVLPDAFLRRCLVLPIQLPNISTNDGQDEFVEYLVKRGEAHFPKASKIKIVNPLNLESESKKSESLPRAAAKLLLKDRLAALRQHQSPIPGQAEYLDFLRAIMSLSETESPQEVFQKVQSFVFRKSTGS
jgi:MoxR-like ATPase